MSQSAVDFSCTHPDDLEQSPTGTPLLSGAGAYETLKDSMGRFRTLSLFVEHKHDKYPAPFTLKPYPHKNRMSMYQKYMEIGDPTEYSQAIALLGNWDHWQVLCNCDWFPVEKWREELRVKMESDRYLEMEDVSKNCARTPQGVAATKWLAERYGTKPAPKRGRPSKAEKAAALKQEVESKDELLEDAERLGL